jgi:hypothetical protein
VLLLEVPTLLRPELYMDVSTPQGPELHLDVSKLQRALQHLDVSTPQGPVLLLDLSSVHYRGCTLTCLHCRGLCCSWSCLHTTVQVPELHLDVAEQK